MTVSSGMRDEDEAGAQRGNENGKLARKEGVQECKTHNNQLCRETATQTNLVWHVALLNKVVFNIQNNFDQITTNIITTQAQRNALWHCAEHHFLLWPPVIAASIT